MLLAAWIVAGAGSAAAEDATERIEHVQREIEGWTVHVDKRLLAGPHKEQGRRGLRILANKLYEIALIVPQKPLARLREVPVYVDLDHPLQNLQYHPHAGWLREHGYDDSLARCVHIPRVRRLVDLTRQGTQPWAVLHELAHAYHHRVLGFDHGPLREAFDRVTGGTLYESVLHIGGERKRHYALTDHKEFFAEMTECYLATNDFYPFVRAELADVDPETYALMERIWRNPDSPEDNKTAMNESDQKVQAVIDEVEQHCRERTIHMIGPKKAERLAELVRENKPRLVVECGTAVGYSGLWIARELERLGEGRLITIEIDEDRARQAEENFEKAGVADLVEVRVGDARRLVEDIDGPVDFLFLDCNFPNYHPCFVGIQDKLAEGAVVVADNVGIGAASMRDFLKLVRSRYRSQTEWFDIDLPWAERDALEITVIRPKERD